MFSCRLGPDLTVFLRLASVTRWGRVKDFLKHLYNVVEIYRKLVLGGITTFDRKKNIFLKVVYMTTM